SFADGFAGEVAKSANTAAEATDRLALSARSLGEGVGFAVGVLREASVAITEVGADAGRMVAKISGLDDGVRTATESVLAYSAAHERLQEILSQPVTPTGLAQGLAELSAAVTSLQEAGRLSRDSADALLESAEQIAEG